ncbi:MAG: hypothetical protein KBC41_00375 [Candidatus Pacebacteria bacterium]|nr:hypothetical protein [Candidatus Paceibacterota bacterium]MBP9866521.1 hypothetical protein [Candidatus Paceibacterota bacterium]
MKKVTLSTIALSILISSGCVFAEEVTIQPVSLAVPLTASVVPSNMNGDVVVPVVPEISSVYSVTEKAEVIKVTSLEKMKARGSQLIKERVSALNGNAVQIAKSKGLTPEQKTMFATKINTKVSELNALGVKISTSPDASSTKVLVGSIFSDFRIYAIVIPQIRLEKRIYELQNHSTKLNETFVKVQTNIDTYKAKGKDVTVWQKGLDDAKVLVASETQKLPLLLAQITALKPSDYGTTSKATIESVNKSVKAVAVDFQSIHKKVKRPEFMRALKKSMTSTTTVIN